MKLAKYNGVAYEVKPTGRKVNKPAKSYIDFNGYDTDKAATNRNQMGLYSCDKLEYILGTDGKTIFYNGTKHGEVSVKEV